jgi:hypothetical protein
MIMAELEKLILTAGLDLDAVASPENEAVLERGDMMMADGSGHRFQRPPRAGSTDPHNTADTERAFLRRTRRDGVGEDAVRAHLEDIRANVQLVAAEARVEELSTLTAA